MVYTGHSKIERKKFTDIASLIYILRIDKERNYKNSNKEFEDNITKVKIRQYQKENGANKH